MFNAGWPLMRVTLVDVYMSSQGLSRKPLPEAIDILYQLLQEREPHINISHHALPTPSQHKAFVASEPYLEWFLIRNEELKHVGAIYVTRQMEVGIFVLKAYRGTGYGASALTTIKARYPKTRLLANIAPGNKASQEFFESAGFTVIQHTYELRR